MVSFAYPIDRLDWALFSFVILCYQWFPLLEYWESGLYFAPQLPHGFDHFLWGGASILGVVQTGVTLEKLMMYQISVEKMKIHVILSIDVHLTWYYVQYHHHSAGQA